MSNKVPVKLFLKKLRLFFISHKQYFNEYKIIRVYSHPRSGTHFLEAFLARNFYHKKKLKLENIEWGHWANRMIREDGNEYGKLFGSHEFPGQWIENIKHPMIYIYRDGRDVAYSIWKTPNFINPKYKNITFSEFLRIKLDWNGTPGNKIEPKENIAQHWIRHVEEWHKIKKKKLLIVKYEELLTTPRQVFQQILKKFFPIKYILYKLKVQNTKIDIICDPVGLIPNQPRSKNWKSVYTFDDNMYFLNNINSRDFLYYQ